MNKLGGAAFVAAGLLFLLRAILDFTAGPPPRGGAEILAWVASHRLVLSLDSEILFFAGVCLVPGVIALYHSLVGIDRAKAALGCGVMAVAITVLASTLVQHGRLVYPVYGIRADSPDLAALVVALFYGGMHVMYLLLAGATFVLSLAMRGAPYGKPIAYLGLVTAAADIAAGYPDAIGSTVMLVTQVFFTAWFCAVGWKLRRA